MSNQPPVAPRELSCSCSSTNTTHAAPTARPPPIKIPPRRSSIVLRSGPSGSARATTQALSTLEEMSPPENALAWDVTNVLSVRKHRQSNVGFSAASSLRGDERERDFTRSISNASSTRTLSLARHSSRRRTPGQLTDARVPNEPGEAGPISSALRARRAPDSHTRSWLQLDGHDSDEAPSSPSVQAPVAKPPPSSPRRVTDVPESDLRHRGPSEPASATSHWGRKVQDSFFVESDPSTEPSPRSQTTTVSSSDTTLTTRTSLEETLASFPSPPVSGHGVGVVVKTNKQPSRSLSRSTDSAPLPPLAARVSITPEVESIMDDRSQSIWMAVEVAADVNHSNELATDAESDCGLNLVVCLDLSACTSPSTLMNAHEIVLLIASMLDPLRDRLALVGTHTAAGDGVIMGLTRVDFENTRHHLDKIRGRCTRSDRPTETALEYGLATAARLLSKVVRDGRSKADVAMASDRPALAARGHILLLSGNPGAAPLNVAGSFPIHLVNPAIVPWTAIRHCTKGWQLSSMFPPRLHSTALCNDSDGLPARLREVLAHLRTSNTAGKLDDVQISIRSGPNCEIIEVLGDTSSATLGAGQVAQLFVKVHVGHTHPDPPGSRASDAGSRMSSMDMLAQLDAMLGEATTPALTVTASYQHASVPHMNLSAKARSSIRRHTRDQSWGSSQSSRRHGDTARKVGVYQRLAFFLATHHTPRAAVRALQDYFGPNVYDTPCPTYLKQIIEELRYHATTVELLKHPLGDRLNVRDKVFSSVISHPTAPYHRPLASLGYDDSMSCRSPPARVGPSRTATPQPENGRG
ncbi:MAG: hypothetical protein M1838_001897 [Thelocarpon superellum]|nr:MAG: hypothetical protein M1838_001897 [Thelocarpon superellum]